MFIGLYQCYQLRLKKHDFLLPKIRTKKELKFLNILTYFCLMIFNHQKKNELGGSCLNSYHFGLDLILGTTFSLFLLREKNVLFKLELSGPKFLANVTRSKTIFLA